MALFAPMRRLPRTRARTGTAIWGRAFRSAGQGRAAEPIGGTTRDSRDQSVAGQNWTVLGASGAGLRGARSVICETVRTASSAVKGAGGGFAGSMDQEAT